MTALSGWLLASLHSPELLFALGAALLAAASGVGGLRAAAAGVRSGGAGALVMTADLRLGMIGAGWIADRHLQSVSELHRSPSPRWPTSIARAPSGSRRRPERPCTTTGGPCSTASSWTP